MTWQELLDNINQDFFRDRTAKDLAEGVDFGWVDFNIVKSQWLGFPAATMESILAKEATLGSALPPSYREFLLHSNGFRDISPFLNNLFPIEKIDWARNFEIEQQLSVWRSLDMQVSDENYYNYGPDQDPVWYRPEYIKDSLKICEWCDGMCVYLNPNVKFALEWEVIQIANWFPGARRYRSFKDFIISVHEENAKLLHRKNNYS